MPDAGYSMLDAGYSMLDYFNSIILPVFIEYQVSKIQYQNL